MEQNPAQIMARFCAAKVLTAISPTLRWRSAAGVAMARLPELSVDVLWKTAVSPDDLLLTRFALWMVSLPASVQQTSMTQLMVRKATREIVTGAAGALAALKALPDDARASVVDQKLRPFMPLSLFIARVYVGQSPLLDMYYGEWKGVETAVNGADIRALGLPPSPAYGRILETLRAARLDGDVQTDDGERVLLAALVDAEMG